MTAYLGNRYIESTGMCPLPVRLALPAAILYCGAIRPECSMGLGILIIGLAVFLATHVFVSFREARAGVIERLGPIVYRGVFAVVSLAGLALIIWGYAEYRGHGFIQLWSPPAFMRHITIGLMLFAAIFVVAWLIPSHIRTGLKHPLLAGVKTWALAHLLVNGDLGSILMFGTFLAWGVYARISAKRRGDAGFGATAAPASWANDIIVVVLGVAIFLALGFWFHPYVISVPVFGR